jgi:hypothetical protein
MSNEARTILRTNSNGGSRGSQQWLEFVAGEVSQSITGREGRQRACDRTVNAESLTYAVDGDVETPQPSNLLRGLQPLPGR